MGKKSNSIDEEKLERFLKAIDCSRKEFERIIEFMPSGN
jgi:hypothetical protein